MRDFLHKLGKKGEEANSSHQRIGDCESQSYREYSAEFCISQLANIKENEKEINEMTIQMILALAVLIIMIALIMFDVMPFGAPPILACILLVLTGLSTVPEAFAGFANSSVIMIATFMVVLAGVQKTRLMDKVKEALISLVNKGGYKSYALLVIVVMLGASLVGGGNTGYYVLILSLISTIPYTEKMPTSKLMMPLGFATNHPLLPFNVALYYGVVSSVLETAGYMEQVSMVKFAMVNFVMAAAFLAWCLVSYKLLPDHPIAAAEEDANDKIDKTKAVEMPAWKEKATVLLFIISVIGMMLLNTLGNMAYAIPGMAAMVLLLIKVVDFKEYVCTCNPYDGWSHRCSRCLGKLWIHCNDWRSDCRNSWNQCLSGFGSSALFSTNQFLCNFYWLQYGFCVYLCSDCHCSMYESWIKSNCCRSSSSSIWMAGRIYAN